MSPTVVTFLYQWQTLVGSALGPFLGILLSVVGFWIASAYRSARARKEAIRAAEISVTVTLNDLYSTRKKLEKFARRLRQLAAGTRSIDDDNTYCLNTTNFPAARDVFFNSDLPNLKFGSPYLHNHLMFSNSAIKEINSWLAEMKGSFTTLMENNKFMVTLEPKPKPRDQRTGYANDLDAFASAVGTFLISIKTATEGATRIKIYNLKLMENRLWTIWKHEGTSFKYFKNSAELEQYQEWSTILNRVDDAIKAEVDASLAEIEVRHATL